MEPARGSSANPPESRLRQRPAHGKPVTSRLAAIGGLLLVVGLGLLLVLKAPNLLPTAKCQVAAPPATTDKPVEPAASAAAEKAPAAVPSPAAPGTGTPPSDTGGAPTLPNPDLAPDKVMPAPPPWPRGADLPVLKRYNIDWERADALLTDIRDHEFDFENATVEHDAAALYYLLRVAATLPSEAFQPAPPDQETRHEELLSMPQSYRGVPVTVSGVVSKVSDFDIPQSDAVGQKKFWVVDIFQEIKGTVAPVFTVVLAADPGALARDDRIRVKGYFFKIRDYDSPEYSPETKTTDVYRYQSPMIVGRDYQLMPRDILARSGATSSGLLIGGVLGLMVLAVMVLLFIRRLTARQAELRRMSARSEELTPDEAAKRVAFLEQIEKAAGPPADQLPGKPPAEK